jgi:hypothetical protein
LLGYTSVVDLQLGMLCNEFHFKEIVYDYIGYNVCKIGSYCTLKFYLVFIFDILPIW